MKDHFYLNFCFLTFLFLMIHTVPQRIQANESTNVTYEKIENSIGGMSELLSAYYDTILSKESIRLDDTDVTTLLSMPQTKSTDNLVVGICNSKDFTPVYYSADSRSLITGRMYDGDYAIIKEEEDQFYQITSGEVSGFVPKDSLLTNKDAIKKAIKLKQAYAVVTHDSFLYSNCLTGKKIAPVAAGAQYLIASYNDDCFTLADVDNNKLCYLKRSDAHFYFAPTCAKTLKKAQTDLNCMFWPLPKDHTICTYYGYRTPPIKGASSFHQGLDIGGKKGLSIIAVLSGTVSKAEYNPSRGYYVELTHDNHVVTRYLHCSKLLVKEGQVITQGDPIALVGSTGISTGSHLHFSLEINGKSKDPYPYLKRVQ